MSERDWTAEYKALAETFYRETGLMAPGKSVPLEIASMQDLEKRWEQWRKWLDERDAINRQVRHARIESAKDAQ